MARKYVLGPNAAREFKRLIRGSGEVSRRQNMASAFAFDSEFVFPFTVQWAQSAAEGEGSWIIWLPGDDIVSVDGAAYDPTEELEEVGGDYPEGWYLLDGDALDPDEGGKLFLNMTGGTSHTCEFSASAQTGVEDSHSVAICEASVDAETGARSVKQFVTSSIIIASGDGEESSRYYADERSVSRDGQTSSETQLPIPSNHFQIKGFGKYIIPGQLEPLGTYQAPTPYKIGTSAKSGSSLVARIGDSSDADGNSIGYVRPYIDIGEIASEIDVDAWPSAFEYVENRDDNGNVVSRAIVRNVFVFDDEVVQLDDYTIPSGAATGIVYLRGRQQKASSANDDPEWTWTIGSQAQQAPDGGRVLNFPIYSWENGEVSCDYRTSFLSITNPFVKAKVTVAIPGEDASIVLDSTGGGGKFNLKTSDVPSNATIGVRTLTIKQDGTDKGSCKFVGDKDLTVDLEKGGGGGGDDDDDGEDQEVVTDVDLVIDTTSSVPRLVLKKTVKTCKVVEAATGAGTTTEAASITLDQVDTVVSSEYSVNEHTFVNKTKKISVLDADASEQTSSPVFTTTPHSSEE